MRRRRKGARGGEGRRREEEEVEEEEKEGRRRRTEGGGQGRGNEETTSPQTRGKLGRRTDAHTEKHTWESDVCMEKETRTDTHTHKDSVRQRATYTNTYTNARIQKWRYVHIGRHTQPPHRNRTPTQEGESREPDERRMGRSRRFFAVRPSAAPRHRRGRRSVHARRGPTAGVPSGELWRAVSREEAGDRREKKRQGEKRRERERAERIA